MPKLNPTQAADKQVRNLSGSTAQIRDGVNAVTESPMEKAAANEAGYLAGVQRAVESGKWAASLRRVDLATWKKNFLEKGIPRIASGAQAAKPKLVAFYTEFFPFLDTVERQIAQMPKVTLQDSINRATAAITKIAGFTRTS